MKKSEAYNLAQIAVVTSPLITPESKLEVLRVLMDDEDAAKYWEEREAKRQEPEMAVEE